jgi:hypothetical protein
MFVALPRRLAVVLVANVLQSAPLILSASQKGKNPTCNSFSTRKYISPYWRFSVKPERPGSCSFHPAESFGLVFSHPPAWYCLIES